MKKLFLLAICLLLSFSIVACKKNTTNTDDNNDLDFYPLPDGTYGVKVGKSLYLEEITIPARYNGKSASNNHHQRKHRQKNPFHFTFLQNKNILKYTMLIITVYT